MSENSMSRRPRQYPVDLLRGILIILMALDHANFHIAQQHSSGEYWGGPFPVYPTPAHFFTRFVTHFSAPGFFFLMGVGMVLFFQSRTKIGWSKKEIRAHFLIRGLVLILLQVALNFGRIWSAGSTIAPLWYLGVLAALGAGMIFCIPLLELKPIILGCGAGLFFIMMEVLTPDPGMWGRAFTDIPGVLLIYAGGQGEIWVNYPLLAWIEVVLLGMMFGNWIKLKPEKAYKNGAIIGVLFLVGFLVLRIMNGFGNIRSYQSGSWTEFLNLVKYPPSMTFLLLTLGFNLIMLWIISTMVPDTIKAVNPFLVFGKTPLFSYLGHLVIYAIMGRLLVPQGSSLLVMYCFWLLGLGILYPSARWFGKYKRTQSDRSWVRFL